DLETAVRRYGDTWQSLHLPPASAVNPAMHRHASLVHRFAFWIDDPACNQSLWRELDSNIAHDVASLQREGRSFRIEAQRMVQPCYIAYALGGQAIAARLDILKHKVAGRVAFTRIGRGLAS